MAAPNEAYQAYSLKDAYQGSLRASFKFAKFTSPYTTVEQAKSLFHLDGMLNEGTSSFIGFVEPNSANSRFHAASRIDTYIVDGAKFLYDGGLNCLPEIPIFRTVSGNSTSIDILNNSIFLYGDVVSSYYNDTTDVYVSIDNLNDIYDNGQSESAGSVLQGQTELYRGIELEVPVSSENSSDIIFRAGSTYVLYLTAVNEEGVQKSSNISITPLPGLVNFHYGTTLPLAIAATAGTATYLSRTLKEVDVAGNLVFYSNYTGTAYANTGYYVSITADNDGNYAFYRVTTSEGRVTEINKIAPRHQDQYYYYSTVSAANAITNSPELINLYYKVEITPPDSDFENRTYYDSPFVDADFAAQGYYVREDRTTVLYVDTNGSASVLIG